MSHIVGLDAGCAAIKVVYQDKKGCIVESSVLSLAKSGKASIGMSGVSGVTYLCDGEEWSICASGFGAEDTRFNDYPFSTLNAVLSWHALVECGFEGQPLQVSSGLPINQFYNGVSGPIEDNILKKHNHYQMTVSRLTNCGFKEIELDIESIMVCPESVAAWADVCLDDDGQPRFEVINPVGLVDIGGRTTDIAVITGGLQFEVVPEYTGTINIGYLDIYQRLNEFISNRFDYHHHIDISVMEQAVRSGQITLFNNQPIDISEQIADAKKDVTRRIMREVGRRFSKVNQLAGVCYSGGGAEDMRSDLMKENNMIIPDRAAFANARGYRKIALLGQ